MKGLLRDRCSFYTIEISIIFSVVDNPSEDRDKLHGYGNRPTCTILRKVFYCLQVYDPSHWDDDKLYEEEVPGDFCSTEIRFIK